MAIFISESVEDTLNFGRNYARLLHPGDVVIFKGEMGAGKTVICKGIAQGLGIEEEVLSPTYAYMNDYSGKLYHYDCYRLESGERAEALGLCDYFYMDGICVIEWAENIADVLPENCKTITVEKLAENKRRIIYE